MSLLSTRAAVTQTALPSLTRGNAFRRNSAQNFCRRRISWRIRAASRRNNVDWNTERAPAPLAPPPLPARPPPPPPPPPGGDETLMDGNGGRRVLLSAIIGAVAIAVVRIVFDTTVAAPGMQNGRLPYASETGIEYLTTKGGNRVAVSTDAQGHVWMVDRAGDLYFDTGDPNVGFFVVDPEGEMVNMWEENGKTQRKMVGNINELANVRTKELGDVSAFPTRDSSQDIDIATFAQENEMSGGVPGAYPRFLEDRVVSRSWFDKLLTEYKKSNK